LAFQPARLQEVRLTAVATTEHLMKWRNRRASGRLRAMNRLRRFRKRHGVAQGPVQNDVIGKVMAASTGSMGS
ncbi:MAG TPA: hypothetical protein PKZ97_15050, partial [Azospirillaceae bacterium]|nr:hypothetical protein [Azospirillaceae bacterium]